MVFKSTHVRIKSCLPLYILCFKLSRFRSRQLQNLHQNNYNYIKLEAEINFQNAITFVLVKLETKFNVQFFLEKTSLATLPNFNIFLTI